MADGPDDLLNPDEIEALLKSAGGATPPKGSSSAPKQPAEAKQPASKSSSGDVLDPSEIENLMKQKGGGKGASSAATASATEKLLDQAEADLAQAIAPNLKSGRGIPAELGEPAAFQFESFEGGKGNLAGSIGLPALQDVELDLRIELGRTELLIDEVLKLKEGSVVPLDKLAGDPVDILVNGRLIARGEVLVLNDNFCVRVAEILTPDF